MSTASSTTTPLLPGPGSRGPDIAFKWVAAFAASMIVILIVFVGLELYWGSRLAISKFGAGFLWSTEWDPVQEKYGALPFIFGTLVSSLLALLIAVPLGVSTALFLTELAPLRLRQPIIMAIEMLAAVPSVIFGLWGIFILVPWLRDHLFVWLKHYLGFLPLFQGPIYGVNMMAAGIIIAIMILPIVTSISREILRSVPNLQREAAYALGATRWEVLKIAVLSYARQGAVWRGRPRTRAGARGDHGGDDGDRKPPPDRGVSPGARLHARKRRRERVCRGDDRPLLQRPL